MPTTENDLTELYIRSYKCSGDVPPALVGSSATYVNGRTYVFGGRALHSGKLSNEVYICDLENFVWRRLDLSDDDYAPSPRFFHSATAYKHHLVVFGGMGLDGDDASSIGATSGFDERQGGVPQSFQVRTNKTLLGDVAVFDTRSERWVPVDTLCNEATSSDTVAPGPSPRYAHLATLFGSRLLIVGGQDLDEQYVEELNVFDLSTGHWVQRAAFPRAVGLYRSFVATAADTTLLYSNYSFAAVKRALYALSAPPDCALREISDQLVGEPPGLRFPRGHVVDAQTVLMTGTLIAADGHSELALWALDAKLLRWAPVPCGARFRTGSWNQSVVDARTNTLVLFGDSRRDLTYDYQRRRLNYAEIRTVDLRALGYLRGEGPDPLAGSGFMAAARAAVARTGVGERTAVELSFDMGAQFLFCTQFGDAELIANDGSRAAVNSGLLRARWPAQAHMWQAAPHGGSGDGGSGDESGPEDRHEVQRMAQGGGDSGAYAVDASREAVSVLLFYLYTDRIDAAARFGPHMAVETAPHDDLVAQARVLGELLGVARRYQIHRLATRLVALLRWRVTEATAPIIFEAALRADHHGLQARCVVALRDCVAAMRNDRRSPLYLIDNVARAALIRYFPTIDGGPVEAPRVRAASDAPERPPLQQSPTPQPQQSPASMRAPSRSPYEARRAPWDPAAAAASPTINSPASTRYSATQSPDPKRLSSVSPLAAQPLPEDAAVDYDQRGIRYAAAAHPSSASIDSASAAERRPSDSTTASDTLAQFQQQQQQQQQPPQQQQSTRSLIFRPWSKMKKIASSSQVSSDSLPPMPSHASSYSNN